MSLCLLSLMLFPTLLCTEESLWEAIWCVIAQYVLTFLVAKYMHSINENHLLLLGSDIFFFFTVSWVVLAKLRIITLGNLGAENLISFPDSSIPVGSDTALACWWGGSGNTIALLSLTRSQLGSQTQSAKKEILHSLQKCHQDLRGADLEVTIALRTAVVIRRDLAVPPEKHFSQFSSLSWKNSF